MKRQWGWHASGAGTGLIGVLGLLAHRLPPWGAVVAFIAGAACITAGALRE